MVSLSLSPLATSMAGRALASPPSQVQTFSRLVQLWTPPLLSPPPLMSSLLLTKGRRQEPTAPNILQRDGDDDGSPILDGIERAKTVFLLSLTQHNLWPTPSTPLRPCFNLMAVLPFLLNQTLISSLLHQPIKPLKLIPHLFHHQMLIHSLPQQAIKPLKLLHHPL